MPHTEAQYLEVIASCRALFAQKAQDYGASWSVLRPTSVTDQLMIKARRIRTLQLGSTNLVGDSIASEYMAIVNYCIMALLVLDAGLTTEFAASNYQPTQARLLALYDAEAAKAFELMRIKNHDYGEAWREMRSATFTDMILTRLLRIRQIEEHQGATLVSEGVASNYQDALNYAVFALIRIQEQGAAAGNTAVT